MKKLHVGRFTALALGMAGIAAIVFGTFVALRTAQAATADTLAIDMDPTTAGLDASATVPVGNDFTFGIRLTQAPDAYQSYASNTQFPAFVSFVSGPDDWGPTGTTDNAGVGLGAAVLCSTNGVVAPNQIYSGCARISGTQNDTGLTETFVMHCDSDGTGTFHLNLTADLGGSAVATAFGNVNGTNAQQDATTVDGTIICGTGAGGPTNTPTDTATATNTVAPTDTATPTATNTPCSGACPTDTPTATATNTSVPPTSTSTATATNTSTASTVTVRTATPTPGTPTAAATNTPSTGGGTAVPTTPGGGQGGAVGTPTKPGGGQGAGVTLPNTGNGGGHGSLWFGTWIIVAGIIVTAAGGGLYLRQRKA